MRYFADITLPAVLFTALANAYANPGRCFGACNVHDPTLIQRSSDKRYFRFSTGNKISYASATNINGPWTNIGSMLPAGSLIDLPGRDDLWVSHTKCLVRSVLIQLRLGTRRSARQ